MSPQKQNKQEKQWSTTLTNYSALYAGHKNKDELRLWLLL